MAPGAERILVQRGVHDEFVRRLTREARRITQATDTDGDSDIGAMTVDMQVGIVADHVADARAGGATIHTGDDWDGTSRLIPPIVISGLAQDAKILHDETFGPVLPVVPFDTEAEAIERANDTAYGLTGSVWTADADRADRVARAMHCGGVSINNVMATESTPGLPFGGIGDSGMGRYKGELGLHAFCNVKSIVVDKDSGAIEANWFPYTRRKYELFTKMLLAWFSDSPTSLPRFGIAGTRLENYSQKARRD